jgi:4-hydroxy-tetrahydrodipicolinate reductase
MEKGFSGEWTKRTEVLIDFSLGPVVPANVGNAVRAGVPIVVGATGWYDRLEEVRQTVVEGGGACLYSSNFSLGVQTLFYLARKASAILARFGEHRPFIVETHHAQKLDAPSGTALTLRQIVGAAYGTEVPVTSVRAGYFPGSHVVGFDSPVDTLTLEHGARNREGFARGALSAAQWLVGKRGLFAFEQVIFGDEHG